MNSISNVNFYTPQVNFGSKNRNAAEVIDRASDIAVEYLNKNRPVAEKKEIAIRKSVNKFSKFIKDLIEKIKLKRLERKDPFLAGSLENQRNLENIFKDLLKENPPEDELRQFYKNFE